VSTTGSGRGRDRKTVRVRAGQGRSVSQRRWLERQLNDPYVERSRREGYRSRAAYKLIEVDDKHHLLKPGARVVDLVLRPQCRFELATTRRDHERREGERQDEPDQEGPAHGVGRSRAPLRTNPRQARCRGPRGALDGTPRHARPVPGRPRSDPGRRGATARRGRPRRPTHCGAESSAHARSVPRDARFARPAPAAERRLPCRRSTRRVAPSTALQPARTAPERTGTAFHTVQRREPRDVTVAIGGSILATSVMCDLRPKRADR